LAVEAAVQAGASASDGIPPQLLKIVWHGRQKLSCGTEPCTAVELSRRLVVAVLGWGTHGLLENGPDERRKFLDWILFHVEPDYVSTWNRWRRLLAQRNKALASSADAAAVQAWDTILAQTAEIVTERRRQLVADLSRELNQTEGSREIDAALGLVLEPGWQADQPYVRVLHSRIEDDRRLGSTRYGPQRADLRIESSGRPAKELSRGQQKLALASLLILASRKVAAVTGEWPVVVVDDLAAELAAGAVGQLAAALEAYPGQVLIAEHEHRAQLWSRRPHHLFHVEHGAVSIAVK
jgi:DNA replication and repair protein RecF